MVQLPDQLKKTEVLGMTVSSIFVRTSETGGYYETMLFMNGQKCEGLTDYETYSLFPNWEDNHRTLVNKVKSVMAYGPVHTSPI